METNTGICVEYIPSYVEYTLGLTKGQYTTIMPAIYII